MSKRTHPVSSVGHLVNRRLSKGQQKHEFSPRAGWPAQRRGPIAIILVGNNTRLDLLIPRRLCILPKWCARWERGGRKYRTQTDDGVSAAELVHPRRWDSRRRFPPRGWAVPKMAATVTIAGAAIFRTRFPVCVCAQTHRRRAYTRVRRRSMLSETTRFLLLPRRSGTRT